MTKKLLLTFALIALLCPLNAGDLEDGIESYINKDYKTALQKLKPLAEKGDAKAQYYLGLMYYWGKGVKKDFQESAKWLSLTIRLYQTPNPVTVRLLRIMAEENVASAQYGLGNMYYNISYDFGLRWIELRPAIDWYKLAANQGHVDAQYKLGDIYLHLGSYEDDEYKEAFKWFTLATKQGHAKSQHELGNMYRDGKGVTQSYTEAIKWYTLAAEKGNAEAQRDLGFMHYHGNGVKKDYKEAAKWVSLAAKQGNAMAQYFLGLLYYQGQGVEQDYDEAFRLTKLSAEQGFGFGEAQFSLGALHYYIGRGVAKDIIRTYMWITLSFSNVSYGSPNYEETREKIQNMKKQLSKVMTPEQIKKAEQLAEACKENNYKNC